MRHRRACRTEARCVRERDVLAQGPKRVTGKEGGWGGGIDERDS